MMGKNQCFYSISLGSMTSSSPNSSAESKKYSDHVLPRKEAPENRFPSMTRSQPRSCWRHNVTEELVAEIFGITQSAMSKIKDRIEPVLDEATGFSEPPPPRRTHREPPGRRGRHLVSCV